MAGTKLIVDVDDAREKLSLQDLAEINDALEKGLTAAHVFFASALGSVFEESTGRKDVFFLDDNLIPVRQNNQFRLRLKQAFVKPGSASLVYADTRRGVLDPAVAVAVPAEDFYLDEAKGLVYLDDASDQCTTLSALDATSYKNKYIAVTYDAGFGDNTGVIPPEWLREAVLAWLPSALMQKSDNLSEDLKIATDIRQMAIEIVAPYKRESALNFHPIY